MIAQPISQTKTAGFRICTMFVLSEGHEGCQSGLTHAHAHSEEPAEKESGFT